MSDSSPPGITIYSSAICPYCVAAKNFLKSKGLAWTEVRIDTDPAQREKLKNIVDSLHARGVLVIAPMIDHIDVLPLLWEADVNFVQGNCLQEPSDKMDFSFVQDEEITLDSFY